MKILNLYAGIGGNRKLWGDEHEITAFDFIWSSPPCPTHSNVRKALAVKRRKDGTTFVQNKPAFPDMKLYEEIIFLDNYFNGLYVVENVRPYYEPLIEPQKIGRHFVWANFPISTQDKYGHNQHFGTIKEMGESKGFDLSKYKIRHRKDQILRNAVIPELGLHILLSADERNRPIAHPDACICPDCIESNLN